MDLDWLKSLKVELHSRLANLHRITDELDNPTFWRFIKFEALKRNKFYIGMPTIERSYCSTRSKKTIEVRIERPGIYFNLKQSDRSRGPCIHSVLSCGLKYVVDPINGHSSECEFVKIDINELRFVLDQIRKSYKTTRIAAEAFRLKQDLLRRKSQFGSSGPQFPKMLQYKIVQDDFEPIFQRITPARLKSIDAYLEGLVCYDLQHQGWKGKVPTVGDFVYALNQDLRSVEGTMEDDAKSIKMKIARFAELVDCAVNPDYRHLADRD